MGVDSPTRFAFEYEKIPEPQISALDRDELTDAESELMNTVRYEGAKEESRQLMDRVNDEVNRVYEETGGYPDTIVLGVEDYVAIDAYTRYQHDKPAEMVLPVKNVVTVPGRMIHAPAANQRALVEHLESTEQ
jgi:hypothetical protein